MIRRARLSFKPNVRPGGRSVGSGAKDGPSASQPEEPGQPGDITVTAGPGESDKPICGVSSPCVTAEESHDIPEKPSDASAENEPSKPTQTPLQRRKRISTLPNLAKPRVSSSAPVAPSRKPQQAEGPPSLPVSSIPSKDEGATPEKAKVPSSPKSQSGPQEQHVTLPEKRTPIPQVPQFSPLKKYSLKNCEISPIKSVDFIQKEEFTPLKERPSQKSFSYESKKNTPKKLVSAGNLERERLRRAKKLRDLLKDELRKERKEWKAQHQSMVTTAEPERSKMLMRDFIYFIPANNPMTSSFEDTKSIEKAPTDSQLSGTPVRNINNDEDEDLDEEEDDSQSLAPRVKVAEDGSIILDEESLTVEVSRTNKAPIVEGNDPIFERGSTTTYSSFRKSNYSKPWSEEETDMFFLAISMVGTDFSMIGQLFPHRERIEIKNKFKREERVNGWRIDKAFRETTSFDSDFFSKRLERALEAAKRKRATPKAKQPREKKATKPRKKQKDKTGAEQVLSDGEISVLSDEGADARTEEKENEGSVSEECLLQSGKKRRNRKKNIDAKVPEEETLASEDTTTLPKKPRKRAADQVIDLAVDDDNHEDVQVPPDTLQEQKKETLKKKPVKEPEAENIEDDIIIVPSLQGDRAGLKSTSTVLPDDMDSVMYRETGERSLTQSEVFTCPEDSSLMLFTESECFSEPDDMSSLQGSLSVVPGTQTLEDQMGTFDALVESSQDDSVFEVGYHLTSDSLKQVPLEEDMVVDGNTGTNVVGSTESPKPAAIRGRLQRPRPNVPIRALGRKGKVSLPERDEMTEEGHKVPEDNSHSQSQQNDLSKNLEGETLELSEASRKDDPCPVQESPSQAFESSLVQLGDSEVSPPELEAAKKDISKESALPVRGRLVRPKPNLKKAPAKDKPPASQPKSPPKSDSQDPEDIATVSCSIDLTHLSTSDNEGAKSESSTNLNDPGITSTPKLAPLLHGRLQRPKPNIMRSSKKLKPIDLEDSEQCGDPAEISTQDISSDLASCIQDDAVKKHEEKDNGSTNKDKNNDFEDFQNSCVQIKETFSKAGISEQEVIPEPDPAVIPESESKAEKKSPIKEARGPLQRQKPKLLKSCDGKGISENSEVNSENTEDNLEGKIKDLSDLKPTDVKKEDSCSPQENLPNVTPMDEVLPSDLKPKVAVEMSEEVQQPTKPAVPTRGRLQRPKPNLGRALPKRGVLSSSEDSRNESQVEACDKPPGSSNSVTNVSFEAGKTSAKDILNTEEITKSNVLSEETGVGQVERKESSPKFVDDLTTFNVIQKGLSSSENEKSTVPAKLAVTRGYVACPSVSTPQKCDDHEEGKNREDASSTLSLEDVSHDARITPVHPHTRTEVFTSPEEITQSYILPLETIFLTDVDQLDNEEPPSVSVDSLSDIGVKKDVNTPKDEKTVEPSPTSKRNRLQRPKPNLGRSITRPVVSAQEKCDDERKNTKDSIETASLESSVSGGKQTVDLSPSSCPAAGQDIKLCTEERQDGSLEGSAQLDESSCTGEHVEGPSVKPVRNRLQRPKPNLGRASVRKESNVSTAEQKEVNDSSSKIPEHLEIKGDLSLSKDVTGDDGEESVHTSIKPAQLKRGRPIRPVPNLGKPPNKRPNVVQRETLDEEAVDKHLEVSSKRTDHEGFSGVSSKGIDSTDLSQSSSDFVSDPVPSTSASRDSRHPNDGQEDLKQQQSRFGRKLNRPVPTTPPVLNKPSEKVSDRPDKKTSRSVKSVKSKVGKPASSKSKGKTTLVKIRATNKDEDDDDDTDMDFEDENYDMAPDKLNQAPVFVPFSLRSPKPVPAEIEETVEEFEIPFEDLCLPDSTAQIITSNTTPDVPQHMPVAQSDPNKKGLCDGSTEAAMALISMGNSVFQSKLGETLDCDGSTESQPPPNTDCEPKASTLTVQMVCAAEGDSTLNSRAVEIGHNTLALQVENGAVSVSTEEQSNDLIISDLGSSTQSSHPPNVSDALPSEQMSSTKPDALQQDCSMSERVLEDGVSAEETTFILTLVEIPLSEGYPISCDENSVDVLPAPVLVSSGSSQILTPDQSPGTAPPEPPFEPGHSEQTEVELRKNAPRKRSVSVSNDPRPSKKALLCTSTEQQEDSRPITAAFEENEKSCSMPAEIKTEETEGTPQSSVLTSISTEEKVPGFSSPTEKPASFSSPSRLLPSSPSRLQQRPGNKPLGFLSLVCKEKQSKKTKVTNKKRTLKPKCKEEKATDPEEEIPTGISDDAPSSEVPSQSSSSNPTDTETIPSTCQLDSINVSENAEPTNVSENADTFSQESPKSQDLGTEEEAATVSQYFFSDIFMEVDE